MMPKQKRTGIVAGRKRKEASGPTAMDRVRVDDDRIYDAETLEFLKAVDAFRRRHGRVPSEVEGMRMAVGLGWRKVEG